MPQVADTSRSDVISGQSTMPICVIGNDMLCSTWTSPDGRATVLLL